MFRTLMITLCLLISAGALAGTDADGDGWTVEDGDCDDSDALTWPGAPELCDGLDNRCMGGLDQHEADLDGDGFPLCAGDCDDLDEGAWPGAAEVADGLDQDCDARVDEGTEWGDDDGDGWAEVDGDCDDGDDAVSPDAWDAEDGRDNDCDGLLDEGEQDLDRDGDGWSPLEGDCDDSDAEVFPGAPEQNDGQDGPGPEDCDGALPVTHGCGGGGQLALLLPLALLGRPRRRAGAALGLLLALGAGAPASAQAPEETFHTGWEALSQEQEALMLSAVGVLDDAWAQSVQDRREAARREVLEAALPGAREAAASARAAEAAAKAALSETRAALLAQVAARSEATQALDRARSRHELARLALESAFEATDRVWSHASEAPGAALAAWTGAQIAWHREDWEVVAARAGALEAYVDLLAPGPAEDPAIWWRAASGQRLAEAAHNYAAACEALEQAQSAVEAQATGDEVGDEVSDEVSNEAGKSTLGSARESLAEAERALGVAEARLTHIEEELEALAQSADRGEYQALRDRAAALGARFDTQIALALREPAPIDAGVWSELFWRAGVTSMIAGAEELGWRQLRQAAAGGALAEAEVPHTIAAWLARAEQEVAALPAGVLRLGEAPPEVELLVNGRPAATGEELTVTPGFYRVTIVVAGASAPWTQVVAVEPGSYARQVWSEGPIATPMAEALELTRPGAVAAAPPRPEARAARPWWVGAGGQGGWTHGGGAAGPGVALRYQRGWLGLEAAAGQLLLEAPIWLVAGTEVSAVTQLSGGVSARIERGRWGLGGGAGAWGQPRLSVGPEVRARAGFAPSARLEVSLDLVGGWDLASHGAEVPRATGAAALTLWFRPI
jgi:hypothetical protein